MTQLATGPISSSELKELALFDGVDLSRYDSMLGEAQMMDLPPGEVLLNKGIENNNIFVVVDGRLSIHLDQEDDAIAFLEKGDTAGEMSVIAGHLTSAYVKADVRTRVLKLAADVLWAIFDAEPKFARNVLEIFALRLVHLNAKISTAQALQEQYKHRATTDALTGLYNRHWLSESLDFEMSRCALRERPLSLLMLDIDHFKQFNDTHGHVAGDHALKAVAHAVQDGLRGSDLAVRYGGEEMVVILPGSDLKTSEKIAERLHRNIRRAVIRHPNGSQLPQVTVSIGLAQMAVNESPTNLIERADAALYRAKHDGRNRTSL